MDKMEAVKALFDTMPMAFAVTCFVLDENRRPSDMRLVYGNPALARIVDRPAEELTGCLFYSLFPEGGERVAGALLPGGLSGGERRTSQV